MKKVFMLILIFTMLFTINVFAVSIPQKVLQKIEDENLKNYVVVSKENAIYIGYVGDTNYKPYYYDIHEQDIVFKDATGNILDCHVFYSDDNGFTWKREFYNNSVLRAYYLPFNSTFSHDTILTSKYNVILQSDNSVFFSAPVPTMAEVTQAVGMKSLEEMSSLSGLIGIFLVGSVALWKGWHQLKTTLSGA